MGIFYATREQVLSSLEILQSSYAGSLIDAKIDWASRSIEHQCHRRFYPEIRTIAKDFPSPSYGYTWEVDLGDQEMISLTSVLSGGTNITSSCLLRRGDDAQYPPYGLLQTDLSSNAAFSAGNTFQRALAITGLFGTADTDTSLAGAAVTTGFNASVQSITLGPSAGQFTPGIGSVLLCGTERMIVRDRSLVTSGSTISADVLDKQASTIVSSAGASTFAKGEIILIDGERMRINDIAGNNLIVSRAWDGTVLSTHTTGAAIFALRNFTVTRGALGTTAASHLTADLVYAHTFAVNEWCIAETVCALEQNAGAYARTIGTGSSTREAVGGGLTDIREMGFRAYGRKGRSAAI